MISGIIVGNRGNWKKTRLYTEEFPSGGSARVCECFAYIHGYTM